jgi:hypothetical protein
VHGTQEVFEFEKHETLDPPQYFVSSTGIENEAQTSVLLGDSEKSDSCPLDRCTRRGPLARMLRLSGRQAAEQRKIGTPSETLS